MAETAAKTTRPRKTAAKPAESTGAASPTLSADGANPETPALTSSKRAEAKSRFTAALDEARAGAALLGAEAKERVGGYTTGARTRGDDWVGDAKVKAGNLAVQGKAKASEALTGLSRVVSENAATLDANLGPKYGDYARTASQKIQDTASRIDQKSVEELGEDAREFVRKSPGTAVALAGLAGFFLARLFRR